MSTRIAASAGLSKDIACIMNPLMHLNTRPGRDRNVYLNFGLCNKLSLRGRTSRIFL